MSAWEWGVILVGSMLAWYAIGRIHERRISTRNRKAAPR